MKSQTDVRSQSVYLKSDTRPKMGWNKHWCFRVTGS